MQANMILLIKDQAKYTKKRIAMLIFSYGLIISPSLAFAQIMVCTSVLSGA